HCDGDTHIDDHHTVEDIGITLGQAFAAALGDKAGLRRYGHSYVPLDESLTRVVIDFSVRPVLYYNMPFTRARIGNFDVDLAREFVQGLLNLAQSSLHIYNLQGENAYYMCETVFKVFGSAVRMAAEVDTHNEGVIPSSKGLL